MAGQGQGYDLSATTYSPDGRLFQIDYAQKCVDTNPTCLAICCKDGVVLATQKMKLSKMLVHGTNRRAYPVSRHVGCALSGLVPDGRQVMQRARDEASSYKSNFGEHVPPHILAERVGFFMHHHTVYYSYRPIGTSILLGHYDSDTAPSVWCVEPSGLVTKWVGKAVGKGRQLANTEIEKLDLAKLTCKEALFHCARILHKVHDENKDFELEINWVCKDSGYEHAIAPKDLVDDAEKRAKTALEEEDDD